MRVVPAMHRARLTRLCSGHRQVQILERPCYQSRLQAGRGQRPYSTPAPNPAEGPLTGLRVLDFGRVLAAPFCTQIFADYGADVIKIEQPGTGDDARTFKGKDEDAYWKPHAQSLSLYFAALNRNKRSITLDLKQREAVEVVERLVETADVIIENFIPGRTKKLGINYEKLSKINPRIVYCSLSGYGSTGPHSHRAGYDTIAAAEGGLMHITGNANGPPVRPGLGMIDMSTGLYAHGAIMSALFHRQQTGQGQHIDISLFETQISLLAGVASNWMNIGKEGQRYGAGHPTIHPIGVWQCADGVWLSLSITNDRQFKLLCERIGQPEMADDVGFQTNAMRVANRGNLDQALSELFKEASSTHWLERLEGSGLAVGPVNSIGTALQHSQVEARDMIQEREWDDVESPEPWKVVGVPVKFSESKGSIRTLPPKLGEHTEQVLEEVGYRKADIKGMRERRIV